jgi:DNA (cytosine-5)-methyltransferase 1
MNPLHRARLAAGAVGAAYRRVRVEEGGRVQRAEVRVDGLAGCLRTPAGGSSRQFVVREVDGELRSRLLTAREGARLMGLPDDYVLPAGSTAAWRVVGDGVAVPAVRWLTERLLEPLLDDAPAATAAA